MANNTVETIYVAKGNHEKFIKSLTKEQKKYIETSKKANKESLSFGKALGGLSAAVIAKKAIGAVVKETIQFEKGMSNVKALLKPTTAQFDALSASARELGKTTAFSATQSAEAFAELGKLGFKTNQILASSADVLNLAAAASTNMATSAEVTAKTINQFNLRAEEAGRVTDVIAKASSSSAIDIFNFKEAMKIAGGVASGFSVSLEESTGAISALADAGLEGTMAGTGLSRMLVEMAKSGSKASKLIKNLGVENGTLTEKLQALQERGLTTSEIIDTFGQIAGKSAIALINNADKVDRLTESYENASGAAQEMADVQLDNLDGSLKLLKSASSELALVLGDIFTPALRGGIDLTTKSIQALTKYNIVSAVEGAKVAGKNRKEWDKSSSSLDKIVNQLFEIQGLQKRGAKQSKGVAGYDQKDVDLLNKRVALVNSWVEGSARLKKNEKGLFELEGKGLSDLISLSQKLQAQEAAASKEKEDAGIKAILTAREEKEANEATAKALQNAEKAEKAKKKYLEDRITAIKALRAVSISQMSEEDQAIQKIKDGYKEVLASTVLTAQERANVLKAQKSDIEASEDEFIAKQVEKNRALTTALLSEEDKKKQAVTDSWAKLIEEADTTGQQRVDAERAMREELQAVTDEYDQIDADKRAEQEEAEREALSRRLDMVSQFQRAVDSVVTAGLRIKQGSLNAETKAEIDAVKKSSKTEEEKAKAIGAIEAKAAKKSHDLKMKEWRASLLMSIANTALAVTKTMATMGYPVGIPFAIAAGITGAASTATIAANKPRLANGTVNAFGESTEFGNSGIGGTDSQLALVSPDEMIVKPKDVPLVKEVLNNNTTNKSTTTNNNVFSPEIIINTISSEGMDDVVMGAVYRAQEDGKVDNTRVNWAVE